ncbi:MULTISPECIES: Flp pilus assembly protein CpaB [unclassified Nocardioides]|uniref:Flp pilus assembly protein CpaB n=1 Tax=unclassified Nocardioides TaxID=2615069 RepID=UPI00138F31B9|nr:MULTISPECIES: Flp pilus assembly protein CpaB [unclassified Nocardioides]
MVHRKFLLIGAVLAAVAGTALVFLYVRGADARAESRFDTVQVLRANAPIAVGESITAASQGGKLALANVPRDQVLPDAVTSIEGLGKQVALVPIYPGEQIVTAKFGSDAAPPSALQIPKGQMAMSVNLTDPARVAGFVNPGSQVAIFVNGTEPEGDPYTRLLLDRVTVIGVGSTTPVSTTTTDDAGQATTEALPRTLLTVAVDQEDAQRLLYAVTNGELAFALLTDGSTIAPGPPVTADNLF